ncbi:MAG: hypothetical protein PWQ57_2739 [Desulfovibrionales bacterium]|nr:hypothetical protein [Desulfovibrionales bacterium]
MPSLSSSPDRHVVIDRRKGHYLCFPDVCLAGDGALVVVYNEFDRHVSRREKLLVRRSTDAGRTWSEPLLLDAQKSHCPRLKRLSDGEIVLLEDRLPSVFWSLDNGKSFVRYRGEGLVHGLLDRVLELDTERFLTAGHLHRCEIAEPCIRQRPTEQIVYYSDNRCRTWRQYSILTNDRRLVLCEASLARLQNGDILALMRENSGVGEPMYACRSTDEGRTWSEPRPTPLVGHRPTMGLTSDGRLLVTYRNVAPDGGTAAWLGGEDELLSDFAVHGVSPSPDNPVLTGEGLLVRSEGGAQGLVRYLLRPLTDPRHARASLSVEVRVDAAEDNACCIHFGRLWRIFPDRIVAESLAERSAPHPQDAAPEAVIDLAPGTFHQLRFERAPGSVDIFVDGEHKATLSVELDSGLSRLVLVGAGARERNRGSCVWRSLQLSIAEPRLGRTYEWSWDASRGLPDQWARDHVLELANDRLAAPMDYGYSGWVELPDGRFFCAYHHGAGEEPDYREGFSSHVRGTWFSAEDFEN